MNSVPDIARTLHDAARACGVSIVDLSAKAGLSRPTTRKALNGLDDFRITTLVALAEQLGLDVVLVPKSVSAGFTKSRQEPAYVPSMIELALNSKP